MKRQGKNSLDRAPEWFTDIHPELLALFDHVRQAMKEDAILSGMPCDPGTPDYIECWTALWEHLDFPGQVNPDMMEVITMGGSYIQPQERINQEYEWSDVSFSAFIAVVVLIYCDAERTEHMSWLTTDMHVLDLLIALDKALHPEYEKLLSEALLLSYENGPVPDLADSFPFIPLGLMYMAMRSGNDEKAEQWATRVISDECRCRQLSGDDYVFDPYSKRYLFGLASTHKDYQKAWLKLFGQFRSDFEGENTTILMDQLFSARLK